MMSFDPASTAVATSSSSAPVVVAVEDQRDWFNVADVVRESILVLEQQQGVHAEAISHLAKQVKSVKIMHKKCCHPDGGNSRAESAASAAAAAVVPERVLFPASASSSSGAAAAPISLAFGQENEAPKNRSSSSPSQHPSALASAFIERRVHSLESSQKQFQLQLSSLAMNQQHQQQVSAAAAAHVVVVDESQIRGVVNTVIAERAIEQRQRHFEATVAVLCSMLDDDHSHAAANALSNSSSSSSASPAARVMMSQLHLPGAHDAHRQVQALIGNMVQRAMEQESQSLLGFVDRSTETSARLFEEMERMRQKQALLEQTVARQQSTIQQLQQEQQQQQSAATLVATTHEQLRAVEARQRGEMQQLRTHIGTVEAVAVATHEKLSQQTSDMQLQIRTMQEAAAAAAAAASTGGRSASSEQQQQQNRHALSEVQSAVSSLQRRVERVECNETALQKKQDELQGDVSHVRGITVDAERAVRSISNSQQSIEFVTAQQLREHGDRIVKKVDRSVSAVAAVQKQHAGSIDNLLHLHEKTHEIATAVGAQLSEHAAAANEDFSRLQDAFSQHQTSVQTQLAQVSAIALSPARGAGVVAVPAAAGVVTTSPAAAAAAPGSPHSPSPSLSPAAHNNIHHHQQQQQQQQPPVSINISNVPAPELAAASAALQRTVADLEHATKHFTVETKVRLDRSDAELANLRGLVAVAQQLAADNKQEMSSLSSEVESVGKAVEQHVAQTKSAIETMKNDTIPHQQKQQQQQQQQLMKELLEESERRQCTELQRAEERVSAALSRQLSSDLEKQAAAVDLKLRTDSADLQRTQREEMQLAMRAQREQAQKDAEQLLEAKRVERQKRRAKRQRERARRQREKLRRQQLRFFFFGEEGSPLKNDKDGDDYDDNDSVERYSSSSSNDSNSSTSSTSSSSSSRNEQNKQKKKKKTISSNMKKKKQQQQRLFSSSAAASAGFNSSNNKKQQQPYLPQLLDIQNGRLDDAEDAISKLLAWSQQVEERNEAASSSFVEAEEASVQREQRMQDDMAQRTEEIQAMFHSAITALAERMQAVEAVVGNGSGAYSSVVGLLPHLGFSALGAGGANSIMMNNNGGGAGGSAGDSTMQQQLVSQLSQLQAAHRHLSSLVHHQMQKHHQVSSNNGNPVAAAAAAAVGSSIAALDASSTNNNNNNNNNNSGGVNSTPLLSQPLFATTSTTSSLQHQHQQSHAVTDVASLRAMAARLASDPVARFELQAGLVTAESMSAAVLLANATSTSATSSSIAAALVTGPQLQLKMSDMEKKLKDSSAALEETFESRVNDKIDELEQRMKKQRAKEQSAPSSSSSCCGSSCTKSAELASLVDSVRHRLDAETTSLRSAVATLDTGLRNVTASVSAAAQHQQSVAAAISSGHSNNNSGSSSVTSSSAPSEILAQRQQQFQQQIQQDLQQQMQRQKEETAQLVRDGLEKQQQQFQQQLTTATDELQRQIQRSNARVDEFEHDLARVRDTLRSDIADVDKQNRDHAHSARQQLQQMQENAVTAESVRAQLQAAEVLLAAKLQAELIAPVSRKMEQISREGKENGEAVAQLRTATHVALQEMRIAAGGGGYGNGAAGGAGGGALGEISRDQILNAVERRCASVETHIVEETRALAGDVAALRGRFDKLCVEFVDAVAEMRQNVLEHESLLAPMLMKAAMSSSSSHENSVVSSQQQQQQQRVRPTVERGDDDNNGEAAHVATNNNNDNNNSSSGSREGAGASAAADSTVLSAKTPTPNKKKPDESQLQQQQQQQQQQRLPQGAFTAINQQNTSSSGFLQNVSVGSSGAGGLFLPAYPSREEFILAELRDSIAADVQQHCDRLIMQQLSRKANADSVVQRGEVRQMVVEICSSVCAPMLTGPIKRRVDALWKEVERIMVDFDRMLGVTDAVETGARVATTAANNNNNNNNNNSSSSSSQQQQHHQNRNSTTTTTTTTTMKKNTLIGAKAADSAREQRQQQHHQRKRPTISPPNQDDDEEEEGDDDDHDDDGALYYPRQTGASGASGAAVGAAAVSGVAPPRRAGEDSDDAILSHPPAMSSVEDAEEDLYDDDDDVVVGSSSADRLGGYGGGGSNNGSADNLYSRPPLAPPTRHISLRDLERK